MSIENSYPVALTVERPESFARPHVFLRLLVLIAISILAAFAWLVTLFYIVIPIVAAAFISSDGAERFREHNAARLRHWLHWVVAFDSYFTFLTDKIPTERPDEAVSLEVRFGGEPTTGSALLRLIMSIPSAFVLALLGIAATITAIIAGVLILVREDYPDSLYRFHLGVVRWGARLLAYHASLVDEYPPFGLDTDQRPQTSPGSSATANPTV
jgi:hypothetical protein